MKDKHPLRRPEVLAQLEQWTTEALRANDGTGRVVFEFDFQEWRAISYRPIVEGRRRRLTAEAKRR